MKDIYINITDHDSECSDYYQVSWKLPTAPGYTPTENQFNSPIVIPNMPDGVEINVRIVRFCCNGRFSEPATTTISATPSDTPTTFTATPADAEVILTWDNDPNIETYVLERAEDAGFNINLVLIYTGPHVIYSDSSVDNGTQYFYRLKGQSTGHPDSPYVYDDATPNP